MLHYYYMPIPVYQTTVSLILYHKTVYYSVSTQLLTTDGLTLNR